ncbi:MAG: hypothetical protein KC425_16000, partial [Anaerolineales bacterium]|nr:hypothetical protein [Anaerolineales bacterium]
MAKTAVSATITLPYSQVEARTASRFRHHAKPKEAPITSLLTSAELPTAVHAALRAWSHTASTPTDLLAGLLLVQAERASTGGHSPTTRRLATNHVLHRAIELLQAQDPVGAQVLTRRFMDGENVLLVAHQLNLSEDQVKRRQRDALASLTRILWEQETAVRHERTHTQLAQLPPPSYTQLLGVDHA